MHRILLIAIAVVALTTLSGCLPLNDVARVAEPGYMPDSNRALVVVGVGVEGKWDYPKFGISLYEYSMER